MPVSAGRQHNVRRVGIAQRRKPRSDRGALVWQRLRQHNFPSQRLAPLGHRPAPCDPRVLHATPESLIVNTATRIAAAKLIAAVAYSDRRRHGAGFVHQNAWLPSAGPSSSA